MPDAGRGAWPLMVWGGTAAAASVGCRLCFTSLFTSAGEWPGDENPEFTLAELTEAVETHAKECPQR